MSRIRGSPFRWAAKAGLALGACGVASYGASLCDQYRHSVEEEWGCKGAGSEVFKRPEGSDSSDSLSARERRSESEESALPFGEVAECCKVAVVDTGGHSMIRGGCGRLRDAC